jgi:hypothetical protein
MDKYHKLEIADVFREGFDAYCEKYGPLPKQHYQVANAVINCRTATMGGHIDRCENCGHEQISYNSCRNRHCPRCQAFARAKWVQDRMEELLPVQYFHIVFTVPQQLNPFALRNKRVFYNILFRAVSETISELAKDPKWLGVTTGFMAVLHSWGQNLLDHPHIHCIVPGGGMDNNKPKWKHAKKDFILPNKVMASLFRGKCLDYFKKAVKAEKIMFWGNLGPFKKRDKFKNLINSLYQKDWVVYAKPPFAGPEAVIKYLGNYTHRIAIANSRLISMENGAVTFKWKSYTDGGKTKIMTLPIVEFIRRFLLHVLPTGFKRIRQYGFLSNRVRSQKLSLCREWFGQKQSEKKVNATKWNEIIMELTGVDPTICPVCHKGRLKRIRDILKSQGQVQQIAAVA